MDLMALQKNSIRLLRSRCSIILTDWYNHLTALITTTLAWSFHLRSFLIVIVRTLVESTLSIKQHFIQVYLWGGGGVVVEIFLKRICNCLNFVGFSCSQFSWLLVATPSTACLRKPKWCHWMMGSPHIQWCHRQNSVSKTTSPTVWGHLLRQGNTRD